MMKVLIFTKRKLLQLNQESTTEEIIDFYCRFGNKKMTAERFCITVKELNAILKGAKTKKDKNDKYAEIGMSRKDF